MSLKQILKSVIAGAAIVFWTAQGIAADETKAQEIIYYYLDLLRSGNFESAAGLWEPSCLEQSNRLGIKYDGIPIKADCVSPFVYNYENMKIFLPDGIVAKAVLDSNTIRWKLEGALDSEKITYYYYTTLIGDYYWIIPPHYYYSKGWPVTESKYFRFFINPDRLSHYNELIARSLDDMVESLAAELIMSDEKLNLLADKKIDYYLCLDDREAENLSGMNNKEGYDRGFDIIITRFIPDFHKVALLLLNYELQNPPLFTLPLIREGLATCFVGQWQRAPEVVFDFGDYILKYDIVELDSILTYDQFLDKTSGDITNPVGACLAKYIYSQLGEERFFDLYRSLSGDYKTVSSLSCDDIKRTIEMALNQPWPDIKSGFLDFMEKRRSRHGLIYPGETTTEKVLINDSGLVLSVSDKWLKIEYRNESDNRMEMNLLLDKEPQLADKKSMLFDEQYKTNYGFEGFRFGIKFDKNEIGLYDYAVNQIKAKFIDDPGIESPYYDSTENKITAYFDLELIGGASTDFSSYRILK
ncbi:MAG: hypothetical protein CVT49_11155 [candidate division Zixibacteria bacterium HGW-Zixibacteria-1]|nr:MAG: hypothetical protein CVT49_11155 [candidate division Zixibacteria bacterium HGW-Zixibacteria-1]